jgi:hypothetical protein
MDKYPVGELRPSQIMFSYGIGAIADLPNLAAMVMGLEEWQQQGTAAIAEERLLLAVQKRLGHQVKKLLSLPTTPEEDQPFLTGVPVAPFPTWMVCPRCRLLAPISDQVFELKTPRYRTSELYYQHTNCQGPGNSRQKLPYKVPPKVIPVRFMVACEKGHLDDFPWRYFVHNGPTDCPGSLRLKESSVSGSLAEIIVQCDHCHVKRALINALGMKGKQNMPKCRGRHPHLRSFDDDCDQQMKTILLGASNSWFSLNLSALSIPNTTGKLEELLTEHLPSLNVAPNVDVLNILLQAFFNKREMQELMGYAIEDIWAALERIRQGNQEQATDNLKDAEWAAFKATEKEEDVGKDWHLLPTEPPTDFQDKIEKVILVNKLREVRALIGFTRIQSPGDFSDTGDVPDDFKASLSRQNPKWVPAIEVRGEGIFIQFNEAALQTWEQQDAIVKHYRQVKEAHKNWLNQRNPDLVDKIPCPDMRYLLLHSFAHALMRQFALECGYNAASLRERIYAQVATPDQEAQAGVLIYTAAPDSEGTLGGLVHLGESQRLNYHLNQAFEYIRICASDPLCSDHNPEGGLSIHWAACHGCLFSPETSCERGNKYLDRALLIPTLAEEGYAFFH